MSTITPHEHSTHYREMACQTDKLIRMESPDGYGKRRGVCGDRVEMFIRVQDEIIQSVSFIIDGCCDTNACANTVAHLTEGQTIDGAWEISSEEIIQYLGTLLPEKNHCAELAVGAFYLALRNYRELKRSPWKKIYGAL
jgi:nitrogen fixation NifU-like protein